MYEYINLISTFPIPEEVNVLSPAGQDQVVDNYWNYINQVVFGEITA